MPNPTREGAAQQGWHRLGCDTGQGGGWQQSGQLAGVTGNRGQHRAGICTTTPRVSQPGGEGHGEIGDVQGVSPEEAERE